MKIKVGSRDSRLAVLQSEIVLRGIAAAAPQAETEPVTMKTTGDRILHHEPLEEVGGKGLSSRSSVRRCGTGRMDFTGRSIKDLPLACRGPAVGRLFQRAAPGMLWRCRRGGGG